jgi:hypothetical protein
MEPNYMNLDPEERVNKLLALISVLLGAASVCAGIVPIVGIIGAAIGIFAGIRGRRSESRKIATLGIIVSAFAMTWSIVYAVFAQISGSLK